MPGVITNKKTDYCYGLDGADKLTKREYFAAMAMQGLVASNLHGAFDMVESAVEFADALIEELNK